MKKKQLVFWTIQLKPVCSNIIQKNIDEFEKKHPEIKIVWVDIPIAEAQKRTLASILGNNPPDLVNLNPDFSVILAQRGALEFFSENELKDFHPNLNRQLKFNNKYFAIPFYATSSVTLYNSQIFNTCSHSAVPKTFNELLNIAPDIYSCSKIPVFSINLNESDTLAKILNKYEISNFEKKGSIEKTNEVITVFDNLYKNGYMPKDTLTINHREVVEKYMSNNAAVVVVGSNFIKMVKENAPDTYKNSAISHQLTGSTGKYDIALMNFIIPKKAVNKKYAKEFALLLTNTQNQKEFAKLTNVLPANKFALNDSYFKECSDDLIESARCISAAQINNIETANFGYNNKKAINDIINATAEKILLNPKITKDQFNNAILDMAIKVDTLQNAK